MASGKSAPDPLRAYLQYRVRAWIEEEPGRRGYHLARLAGISGAQITQIKNGGKSVGIKAIRGLAAAFDMTVGQLEQEAGEWSRDPSRRPERFQLLLARPSVRNEDLPGWREAEKQARAHANLPEWCFEVARGRTGIVPRGGATRDYVLAEAWTALQYAQPEDRLRWTNEELDRKADAAEKRAKRKKRRAAKRLSG